MDIRNFLVSVLGTVIDFIIAVIAIKVFMAILSAKSSLIRDAQGRLKGLTDKARQRAEATGFYQRREIARGQRKAERQRSAVESYAQAITYEGPDRWRRARAARLKQRAGGFNAEAQSRAYISGLGQVEKLESQETKDAEFLLKSRGIQIPMELAAIASGDSSRAVRGLSGAGNEALQRAAIRKIIAAQDAEALEDMYMSPTTNKEMLVQEVRDQYSTAKGAGAHIVKLDARQYSKPELQQEAVKQLATLSFEKLAGQDGPSAAGVADLLDTGYGMGTSDRRKLIDAANEVFNDPTTLKGAKTATREALDRIRNMYY